MSDEIKELDPTYGHIVGPFPCQVTDCKGHSATWSATIHKLHLEYYGTTRRRNKVKRKRKTENARLSRNRELKRLKKEDRKKTKK